MNLKKVLIVGLKELDAGKTTLAQALIGSLHESGASVCGFKPKAANSIWFDYDVVHESLSQGRLYGKDSKLLKEASGNRFSEEVISPVHRLWAIPPRSFGSRLSQLPRFIIDRVTLCNGGERHIVILNDALSSAYGREKLVGNLCRKAEKIYRVSSPEELDKISACHYDRAIQLAYRKIVEKHTAVVFESYSNVALPWRGIKDLDLVLVVEPGCIFSYDPETYLSAVGLLTDMRKEVKANNVCELLKPVKTLRISPFRSNRVVKKLQERIKSILI